MRFFTNSTHSTYYGIFTFSALLMACILLNFYSLSLLYAGYYSFVFYFRALAYTACLILVLAQVRSSPITCSILTLVLASELFFSLCFRSANEPCDIASTNFAWRYHPLFTSDTASYARLEKENVDIFNGDSYGFGSGLTDPKQCYTHIVASQLNDSIPPVFIATPGSEIYVQFKKMRPFNKPHLIVHQCYITDLGRPCMEADFPQPEPVFLENFPAVIRPLIQLSSTLQYICYGIRQTGIEQEFYGYFQRCGDNPMVVDKLLPYYDTIIQFAQQRNARLIFLLVPNGAFPEQSAAYINYVKRYLESISIEYLDTSPLLLSTPFKQRVISENDHHLNAEMHRHIAQLLLNKINAGHAH